MSTGSVQEPEYHKLIRVRIKANDPEYRILYKYQCFRPYTCDSLKNNRIKFSRHAELNDAFDLAVRFPEPFGPTYGVIWKFRDLVKPLEGQGYNVPDDLEDIAEYVSRQQLRPLEGLAILAAQLRLDELRQDLTSIQPTEEWCGRVLFASMTLAREWAENTQIFCLSNDPQSHLMWGYYGDGLRGLCIGYGCPIETNPTMLDPARYEPRVKAFDPVEAALNPEKVATDMLYTKPTAWKHEAEWRARKVSFDPDSNGVMGSFFPIIRVIIGCRMPKEQRDQILQAIDLSKVSVWEAPRTLLASRIRSDGDH